MSEVATNCPRCQGDGRIPAMTGRLCPEVNGCGGYGRVEVAKAEQIKAALKR